MPVKATSSLTLLALQYELALLIGQDLRLKKMLQRFFPTALKLLGCKSGHLWLQCEEEGFFEHRYAYPMRDADSWQSNAELSAAVSEYRASRLAPMHVCVEQDTYLQFMPLGAIGFCLLVREGEPFDGMVVEALRPIFERLSTACEACLDHEQTEMLRTVAADNELRLRTIVEVVEKVILQTDRAGQISFINSAWTRMTGFSIEKTLGQRLSNYFIPGDRESVEAALRAVIAGAEGPRRLEARLHTCNGTEPWVSLQLSGNRGLTGFIGSVLTGTITDITEQRKTIDALVQARKQAEEANSAKNTFLANMSHEIRTPMHGVIGLAELALESELTPDVRRHLEMILSSGEHLMAIINDILDYSKIEADRWSLSSENMTLRSIVAEAASTVRLDAQRKGLRFETHVSPGIPDSMRGDPAKLRQILLNLLGNAVKFTPEGNVCLSAELVAETGNGFTLAFSVTDTGIGIAPEKQKGVFDAFAQADGSISRVYGGTGLGLAICQRLVRMMGGVLSLESEVGKGSKFTFTANFDRPTRAADGADSLAEGWAPDAGTTASPLSILVVEDNDVSRQLMSYLLRKLGHTVALVNDGEAAVEACARRTFDLVLMDMQMPVMDGLTAARAIRERESARGASPATIYALTANAMPSDRELCLSAGMDGYLTKPLQRDELDRLLAALKHQLHG
jgi:PAS domain S-box-containing protein